MLWPDASLELLLARERYEFDSPSLVANLLEPVPVRDEDEKQVVLKAVDYYEDGMTPFDAFHAATAETRDMDVLSSENDHEDLEVEQVALEPTTRNSDTSPTTPDADFAAPPCSTR